MNQQEKLLEFKTQTQSLFIQSNSIKDNLLKDMQLKSHSVKLSELLRVENFNQSNFLRPMNNLRLESQIKIPSNKKLESLMVVNLCQFNFHKVKKNSKLESQIKIRLNKKLELPMVEDSCQSNSSNKNHNLQFKIKEKVIISVLQENGDQDFQNFLQITNHCKNHTEKNNGNHGHKTTSTGQIDKPLKQIPEFHIIQPFNLIQKLKNSHQQESTGQVFLLIQQTMHPSKNQEVKNNGKHGHKA